MASRLDLDTKLREIIGNNGKVYFQPPESIKIDYPCFIYSLSDIKQKQADNLNYLNSKEYTVNYISRDCDDKMLDNLLEDRSTEYLFVFVKRYAKNGLYYNVFKIYY